MLYDFPLKFAEAHCGDIARWKAPRAAFPGMASDLRIRCRGNRLLIHAAHTVSACRASTPSFTLCNECLGTRTVEAT